MPVITTEEVWYTTSDGVRYKDKAKADDHQAITDQVDKCMKRLKKVPDTCAFGNGGGYVQQDASVVIDVKSKLWGITEQIPHMRDWMKRQTKGLSECHPSWPLRLLDGSHNALERAWSRLMCIGPKSYREYGQPYYAANEPSDCKEIK